MSFFFKTEYTTFLTAIDRTIFFVNTFDNMNDPLEQSLAAVGLSSKQSRVYLGLLSLGEASVSQIAEAVGLKRPIVYIILDELTALGYVAELPHQKVRRFAASDPARLYHQVAASVENLKFFLPMLRSLRARGGPLPHIEVHESPTAITAAYRQMEQSRISRYLSSYGEMQKHFPDEVARWVRRGHDQKDQNESRHILTSDPASRRFAANFPRHPRHHFRFLASTASSPIDIAVLQGVTAFTSFSPMFLVVIHSERLAETMATLFDHAWTSLRPKK